MERDFVRNNVAGPLLTLAGTSAATRHPRRGLDVFYTAVRTQRSVGNAAFHTATRAPGVATSVAVVLPGLHERLLTRGGVAMSLLVGSGIHAFAVRRQACGR